jgi:putative ABC transport system substrate-binding protein
MKRREFVSLIAGAAATWPLVGRAQQQSPMIGFLHQGSSEPVPNTTAFKKGLSEAGVDMQSVTIEDRAANGHYDRLPELAAELVADKVAVLPRISFPLPLRQKLLPRQSLSFF